MPANTRLGLLLLLIFGGQFLARLLFPSSFGGGSYDGFTVVYGIGAAAGVALLVAGHLKTRRGRYVARADASENRGYGPLLPEDRAHADLSMDGHVQTRQRREQPIPTSSVALLGRLAKPAAFTADATSGPLGGIGGPQLSQAASSASCCWNRPRRAMPAAATTAAASTGGRTSPGVDIAARRTSSA